MAVQVISHPSIDERRAAGKQTRKQTPPSSHTGWRPAADRPDPVALLEAQNLTRPVMHNQFRAYRATLPDDRRKLLERFQIVDAARKVVGVGSVGTRAFIVLLEGRDAHDPLFLQIKEATASVLEASLRPEPLRQHGERVVQGPERTRLPGIRHRRCRSGRLQAVEGV